MRIFRKKLGKKSLPRNRDSLQSQRNSSVFSYHANRNNVEINSERDISRESSISHSSSKMNKFLFLLSVLAVTVSLIYVMTLETSAKVTTLSGSQSQQLLLRNTDVYQSGAEKLLSNSIFNRFKLTINTTSIEETMKETFPELDDVKITIPIMGHRPVFQINASNPAFIITNNQGSFVVNNKGRVMMRVEDIKNLSSLKLQSVIDQSGLNIEKGRSILPDQDAKFISEVIEQFRAKNIPIQSVILPTIPNELDVRIVGKPYVIKFNMANDTLQQIGSYLAVKEKLESEGKVPSLYIDMRVDEKAYYR